MAGQERKQKPTTKREDEETTEEVAAPSNQGEKIKEELDDLLDEIDSVLEENAEEFVRNYIQKGGE